MAEQQIRITNAPQGVRCVVDAETVHRTDLELAALAWDNEYNISRLERQIEKAEAEVHFDRARAAKQIAQHKRGIEALKLGLNRNQPSVDRAVRDYTAWLKCSGKVVALLPVTTAVRLPSFAIAAE